MEAYAAEINIQMSSLHSAIHLRHHDQWLKHGAGARISHDVAHARHEKRICCLEEDILLLIPCNYYVHGKSYIVGCIIDNVAIKWRVYLQPNTFNRTISDDKVIARSVTKKE